MAMRENYPEQAAPVGRSWIRWGAVAAGAAIGIGVMALLTSLFAAIGGEAQWMANNLHWFGFISAVLALFVAGLLAAILSSARGPLAGIFQGLTAWGLILVVVVAFPLPPALGVLTTFGAPTAEIGAGPLWAAFLSLAVGVVVAALGGLVGGLGGADREERRGRATGGREARREPSPERSYAGQASGGGSGYGSRPDQGPGAGPRR